MTVDEVLVHRAGLAANPTPSEMLAAFKDCSPLVEQRHAATAAALAQPPTRRGRFRYSNLGYVVAGTVIEHLTYKPYEEAVTELVLEPLGIRSFGFGPPPYPWGHGGRFPYFQRVGLVVGRGAPADPTEVESDNPAILGPAGRLHLTLDDWSKFQQLFISKGDGLLRPETSSGSSPRTA